METTVRKFKTHTSSTNEYSDSPEEIEVEITQEDIYNIIQARIVLREPENKRFESINIPAPKYDYEGDWRAGFDKMEVGKYGEVYLITENKYDCSDFIMINVKDHINDLIKF